MVVSCIMISLKVRLVEHQVLMGGNTTYFYSNLRRTSRKLAMIPYQLTLNQGNTPLFHIKENMVLLDSGYNTIGEISIPEEIFNDLCSKKKKIKV